MKNPKKLLSIALSCIMISALSTTAFAADIQSLGTEKTLSAKGYSFTITEKVNPNYSVTRTYTRDTAMTRSTPDLNETKALLQVLGMDTSEITAIPSETMQDFATGEEITVVTSYSKHSESSNQTTYLPKETALAEAAALKPQQEAYFLEHPESGISPMGEIPNESSTPGIFKDDYMKMTHAAVRLRNGKGLYKFTTSATWLTTPLFRGFDSIGSCAMDATVNRSTISGSYYYTTKTYNAGQLTNTTNSGKKPFTRTESVDKNDWYGCAGIFTLPSNTQISGGVSILQSDIGAYFEYQGHVRYPEQSSYFNTVGSYSHAVVSVSFTPSVTISTTLPFVSAGIALDIFPDVDIRNAEDEIHYIP